MWLSRIPHCQNHMICAHVIGLHENVTGKWNVRYEAIYIINFLAVAGRQLTVECVNLGKQFSMVFSTETFRAFSLLCSLFRLMTLHQLLSFLCMLPIVLKFY